MQREEELLVGEGHLDVELRDLLDAVGAEILVAEADRDLVVAVEAGDHRQLLEDLRALRQREEAALLQAARDDEVARALGRRLEQDRRLDVEEARLLHRPADDRRPSARAGAMLRCSCVAAQVEPAVAEAQRLVDVLLVELERERRRARDDLEPVDLELDLAGRQLRVDALRRAGDDLALGAEHELVADLVRDCARLGRALGVDRRAGRSRRGRAGRRRRARRGRGACSTQPASVRPLPDVLGRGPRRSMRSRQAHASASSTGPVSGPTTTHVLRAEAARLRVLALHRAAGVVGVGRDAAVARSSASFATHGRAVGALLADEEDVDALGSLAGSGVPRARAAAARCRRRSRRRACAGRRAPRRGRRSGRRPRASPASRPPGPTNSQVVRV